MTQNMLTENKMPFCPGCGHGVAVNNISKALIELNYNPLDVVIVSDIGWLTLYSQHIQFMDYTADLLL